jgi:hydroxyethylthiazole kinase-like uncharacterized protein yjeF
LNSILKSLLIKVDMLEGKKIVTAEEMKRIEGMAYAQGHLEGTFMDNAGMAIAHIVENFIMTLKLDKEVTLLAGKGNNGGDAFTAGALLLSRGFSVQAYHPFPLENCTPLCQQKAKQFEQAGGKKATEMRGVLLDGLVGTGFQGKVEGVLANTISQANQSHLPILSIDIPSGVNGNTGEVGSAAIQALATIYLGLPKIGFFIGQGWDFVGELIGADFGLPSRFTDQAKAEAYLVDEGKLFLPPIRRSRHKYETGYVLGIAGSMTMSGAAALACMGAFRAGAGIVRLFHSSDMETSSLPWEIIREERDILRILEECSRAAALFVGPGLGRTREEEKFLQKLLPKLSLPMVLDADALFFLPEMEMPKKCILTPHRREMERLLGNSAVTLKSCQDYVDEKNATLILKGGPSMVFHPKSKPLIATHGDPGMAKAGTGDVLTGVIAALLSQKCDLRTAAALGVTLHGLAGEAAALEKTPYGVIASDLIEKLPEALHSMFDTNE